MRTSPLIRPVLLTAVILWHGVQATSALASDVWRQTNEFASGTGTYLFVGLGIVAPLFEDGSDGPENSLRVGASVLISGLICQGLKLVIREKRPDGSDNLSFPSGHATAAFSVAEMQRQMHPSQGWAWYAGATLIAESRVYLKRHYWWDSVAGAALGYGVARYGFPTEPTDTTPAATRILAVPEAHRPWRINASVAPADASRPYRGPQDLPESVGVTAPSGIEVRPGSSAGSSLVLVPVVRVRGDGGYLGLAMRF